MKITFFLLLAFITTNTYADNVVFAGLMKEDINQSGVAEIGIKMPAGDSENLEISWSTMLFAHEDNIYDGFNFSINTTFGTDLRPYLGIGAYAGEYKACETNKKTGEETCEYNYTAGVYPEAGVQLSLDKFRLGFYTRMYKTFDAGNNDYKMFGLYLGYEL